MYIIVQNRLSCHHAFYIISIVQSLEPTRESALELTIYITLYGTIVCPVLIDITFPLCSVSDLTKEDDSRQNWSILSQMEILALDIVLSKSRQ